MRSFDDPSAGAIMGKLRLECFRLTAAGNVSRVAPLGEQFVHGWIVVAFVERHVLRLMLGWFRSRNGNALQRGFDEAHVRDIGSADFQADRSARAIREQGTLGT